MELIRGAYRYRLVHRYRSEFGGGKNVIGEVSTVNDLAELLATRTPVGLADLREAS